MRKVHRKYIETAAGKRRTTRTEGEHILLEEVEGGAAAAVSLGDGE